MNYSGRKVLVTGGTGMIGRYLVDLLVERGATVRVASLDEASRAHPQAEFRRVNLTDMCECVAVCQGMEMVFHLAGVKGSPLMTKTKPASFFVPTIAFNTNMMEAARQAGVDRYLFTSTVGVYAPAAVFHEDDVWKTFPSENDRFAGWAKRVGELQAEAYRIEHGWDKVAIVRPANVYGRWDNFDLNNAMVIPALIRRALDGEDPLVVWGDGSPVRDFVHGSDVAEGMLAAMERVEKTPVNLGSGEGVSIRRLVEIVVSNMPKAPRVVWDSTKPSGDAKRLMDITRARAMGWAPRVSIEDGIKDLMGWYLENRSEVDKRHNTFNTSKLM